MRDPLADSSADSKSVARAALEREFGTLAAVVLLAVLGQRLTHLFVTRSR